MRMAEHRMRLQNIRSTRDIDKPQWKQVYSPEG